MNEQELKELEEQKLQEHLDEDQEEPVQDVEVVKKKVQRNPPHGASVETTEIKRSLTKDERLEALQNKDTFKNRRKMAFIALFALLFVQAWMLFVVPYDKVDKYSDLHAWFYGSAVAIVGTYMGTTSIPLFMKRR